MSLLYGHADMAAAEIQLLRHALDRLQAETQNIDDELAKAREQAIFGELERADLRLQLDTVTAQLSACEAAKAELEQTLSQVAVLFALHAILQTMVRQIAPIRKAQRPANICKARQHAALSCKQRVTLICEGAVDVCHTFASICWLGTSTLCVSHIAVI